ncbi:MAG: FAD-dependent oxidoreductase [Bacteroidota bacterium]
MSEPEKKRVVVLGTGFGAFSFVKRVDTRLFDVTVVSPRNHFLFTPLLPSTTVGTIEFRSIIEPLRVARPEVHFYQAICRSVDPVGKTISCEGILENNTFELPFDLLLIAVGSVVNTYGIPGVAEHTLYLKDLADARAIRQRIIECFEQASQPGISDEERARLLRFVVVGGGPTGVEFAAEMHDFLTEDLQKSYPDLAGDEHIVRITLLEAAEQILNSFDAVLSDYTRRLFQRQRIEVRTGSLVTKVEKNRILLKDGTVIPCGLIVWSTGVGPTSFIKNLPFENDRDRLITDDFLRTVSSESIYALGDCATIRGKNLPATAQVAQQQGTYLAKALRKLVQGKSVPEFRYKHLGMLAYVGSNRALADLSSFKGKGFSAWLFWRSAYLTRLVSLKNKILVAFDWVKAFVFGRDISRF